METMRDSVVVIKKTYRPVPPHQPTPLCLFKPPVVFFEQPSISFVKNQVSEMLLDVG